MSRRTGKHRIYMNVGYDLTEQQLRDFFNQFGNVTDVYLPKHKSGRNKGFGFTTFDSDEGLCSALSAQEYVIGGDVVKINRAGPRPEFEESSSEGAEPAAADTDNSRQPQLFGKGPRLYVGGVPEGLTEERLKAHFSRWGNVVDLYFPGKKGQSRVNYCFVTFDNWRAAQRACNQSERNIDGMVRPCSHSPLFIRPPAKLFLMHTFCLQPLQSINLAQERTAEQEQQVRAEAAAAVAAATASQVKSPPTEATGSAANDDVSDLGSSSNFAFLQHLQMQALLQAQQFGYSPQHHAQHHAQLQSILAGQGMTSLPPALSAYPGAYQQMINNLLAQQGSAGMARPSPGSFGPPSLASLGAYDLPAAASPALNPFPQRHSSMPMDLEQLLAAQAQATGQHASSMHTHAQPPFVPDTSQFQHGISLGAADDSASSVNPLGWGWGSMAGNPLLPETARSKSHPALQAHPHVMLAQAQANIQAAAASAQSDHFGPMQLPSGGEE